MRVVATKVEVEHEVRLAVGEWFNHDKILAGYPVLHDDDVTYRTTYVDGPGQPLRASGASLRFVTRAAGGPGRGWLLFKQSVLCQGDVCSTLNIGVEVTGVDAVAALRMKSPTAPVRHVRERFGLTWRDMEPVMSLTQRRDLRARQIVAGVTLHVSLDEVEARTPVSVTADRRRLVELRLAQGGSGAVSVLAELGAELSERHRWRPTHLSKHDLAAGALLPEPARIAASMAVAHSVPGASD